MTPPIHTLLLVENALSAQEQYRNYLMSDPSCTYRLLTVESAAAGLALCSMQTINAILLNSNLPDASGLEFLEMLYARRNEERPPVLIIADDDGVVPSVALSMAIRAIKLGAEDYLLKHALTPESLQFAVRGAIENARLRQQLGQTEVALKAANEQITTIWESMTDAYTALDQDWRFVYTNPASTQVIRRLTNQESEEFLGKTHWEILPWTVGTIVEREYRRAMAEQVAVHFELFYEPSGDWFEVHAYPSQAALGIYFRDITDRKRNEAAQKQIEAALQESEQRFRAIFNTTFQFVGLLSLDGILLEANQTALDFGGLTREEAVGRPFWEVRWWTISPHTQQQLQAAITQARQGDFVRYEVEVLGAGETTTIIDFSLKPMRDDSGQVVLLIPEGRDVSDRIRKERDRKLDERRLQESEERLQLGIYVAGIALARFDYASNTVALSPEAAALYGIPADELIVTRNRIHETFHPDEREMLEQIIEQVLDPAGDGWFAQDHRVVWQSGEVRCLSVRKHVFFDRSGETPRPDYAILAAIDITERKQAEAALEQTHSILEAVIMGATDVVFVKDLQGRYVIANPTAAEWLNTSVEAMLGRDDTAFFPPDVAQRMMHSDRQTIQSGESIIYEEEVSRQGELRSLLTAKYPWRDAAGSVLGVIGISRDITTLKENEAEREQLLQREQSARDEAEVANRSKDEFVAVVAHELRSPLNAISGWAKLLQTRKFDEGMRSKALNIIWRNTQTQVQLIEDLLDISRMVKGTLQINCAPVNLTHAIEAVLDNVQPMAEAKNIELQRHLTVTPLIFGDFNRLQQIVVNLLNNAIKFTPTGGRVEIELEQVDAAVRLRIRDTGKGIAPEFLPYIFERFKQGQQNTGSKDGLGLGLAIVKNLVELHGGTISAESAGVDRGTTFTVRLPRLEVPAIDQSRSTSPIRESSLTGIRILAVDDEPDMLSLITFVLQDFGAEVKSVTTAMAAMDCLRQFKPDILISDLAMPGRDGYELLQQVKSQPEGQIPAIALTSYASATYKERSLQAGFQLHLAKPVEPQVLVAAILELIEARNHE
jgi:PAS domain S-box-containing protein